MIAYLVIDTPPVIAEDAASIAERRERRPIGP
jgi:hypothetical protein